MFVGFISPFMVIRESFVQYKLCGWASRAWIQGPIPVRGPKLAELTLRIHTIFSQSIDQSHIFNALKSNGYKCLYAYSYMFLFKVIKRCWKKIKKNMHKMKIRRHFPSLIRNILKKFQFSIQLNEISAQNFQFPPQS